MIRTLEERVAELERSELVDDNAASPLMIDLVSRIAQLEAHNAGLRKLSDALWAEVQRLQVEIDQLTKEKFAK